MSKLILIDGNSIVNRAFYAMPNLTSSKGICTGGIFGFIKMLSKLVKEEKPTHLAVAFDLKAPTFRHLKYADYKAGRRPMPEELVQQIPLLKELLKKMGVKTFELAGYEADDILGTLSDKVSFPSIIVSGDKDVLQLVSDKCTVYHTKKGISEIIKYTPDYLKTENISYPSLITDLKGLMGDSSDNIKGVKGVGEKTARELIATYGDLDNIYAHIDEIKGKLKDKLVEGKNDAYESKELATIFKDVPLSWNEDDLLFDSSLPFEAYDQMIEFDFRNVEEMFDFKEIVVKSDFEKIELSSIEEFENALKGCMKTGVLAFDIGESVSFTFDGKTEYAVKPMATLFDASVDVDETKTAIKPYLFDDDIVKYVFDLKSISHEFDLDEPFKGNDLLLLSYTTDVSLNKSTLKDLLISYKKNTDCYSCALLELYRELEEKAKENGSLKIYEEIEMPLLPVLYSMEKVGFRVNVNELKRLQSFYSDVLSALIKTIYSYGGEFNINSPKQLAEVLFDKLGLPTDKKRSTSAEKLEKLAKYHPIVGAVLEYRKVAKLQSTYVTALLPLLDENDRLHTVFKQAVTTTGRLSSAEPNLQNIPVRTEEGKEIRKAFIASEGNKLVCADYSQIELRLMAHISGDENMIADFVNGKDVHAATAAKVFDVPLELVTPEMRRNAKAVNFGIIYGISDFGLSQSTGSTVQEAKRFIEKYFQNYPKVKEYMEKTVEFARENGYVKTLSGRVRIIPEIKSSVYTTRQFGERAAMNMPLQGTASDIIKLAMIRVQKRLTEEFPTAKLLLQVHDELIIDCPVNLVKEVSVMLETEMENVMDLKVPLIAEVGVGDNWVEAKE
ncbi:MAG: DNA polymerase I [Clostridia bacterium]|nr:DNA polymerase I [Clostridia bacterium]